MKRIRFSKLQALSPEVSVMLGNDINPNTLVYITTERPEKSINDYTVDELEALLIIAKEEKLKHDAHVLYLQNPKLYEYIKELGKLEDYNFDLDECYE
jgi:hypothetical protein